MTTTMTTRILRSRSLALWRRGRVERGILVCGSGVGASVAANKVTGARAALCHDDFSARQGVEDDDMNILCLGGRTTGMAVAWDCTKNFLDARFSGADRHRRRLAKVAQFEAARWPHQAMAAKSKVSDLNDRR